MDYKPIRGRRRSFRRTKGPICKPKYAEEDVVGDLKIIRYEGHSIVNKRTAEKMAKAQHWYRCLCTCGTEEYRSQQELIDPRRQKKCFKCRSPSHEEQHANQSTAT